MKTENLTRDRIPELDGIRGTAILMVIIMHYVIARGGAPPRFCGSISVGLG